MENTDVQSDKKEDKNDCDVIIVGSGLSGLSAADRLISAGLHILVIEQKASFGGRLLSNEESESFYAHVAQSRLQKMVQRLRLLKKQQESFDVIPKVIHCENNQMLNDNLPFYVAGEIYIFIKTMNDMSKNFSSRIYEEKLNRNELSRMSVEDMLCRLVYFEKSRYICRNFIYLTCGITQLKNISFLWYLTMLNGAGGFSYRLRMNIGDQGRYFIQGGMMSIANSLVKNCSTACKIQYEELVEKINFNDDRAHVWTNRGHYKYDVYANVQIHNNDLLREQTFYIKIYDSFSSINIDQVMTYYALGNPLNYILIGTYRKSFYYITFPSSYCIHRCSYVIIAVPPTENSQITIDPKMPYNMKQAQSSFERGNNVFFNAIFKRSEEHNEITKSIIVQIDNNERNLRFAHNTTCAGDEKMRISGFLSNSNVEFRTNSYHSTLLKQYINVNLNETEEYTVTSIIDGSPMSVLKPINIDSYFNWLSVIHGRVLFAASEYANNWPGTVDGAIEAGERAAFSVLERIRPQSMTLSEWIIHKLIHLL